MPGTFIVVEGPDGAGKTTLAGDLRERLEREGERVVHVREPGGTPAAERLRELILHHDDGPWTDEAELFLILAARAELVSGVIRPALDRGAIVISDRFGLSTVAYQAVGRCLPRALVDAAIELSTGGLTPDLTIILDVPADVGRRRQAAAGKEPDRIERAGSDLHDRVAEFYRGLRGPRYAHVDATGSPGDVLQQGWAIVDRHLAEQRSGAQG